MAIDPKILAKYKAQPQQATTTSRIDPAILAKYKSQNTTSTVVAQEPKKGIVGTVFGGIQKGINVADKYIRASYVPDIVGNTVGVAGNVVGGAVGAVGTPIANIAQGKPVFQDFKKNVTTNAQKTGTFGKMVGTEGTAAAPFAGLGKVPSAVIAAPALYQGIKEKDPTKIAIGGLGLLGAKYSKGTFVDPMVTAPLKRLPGVPQLSSTLKKSAEESIVKALAPTTKENKIIASRIAPKMLERPAKETFAFTRQGLGEKTSLGKEVAGEAINDYGDLKGTSKTNKIVSALEAEKGQYSAGGRVVNQEAVDKLTKVQDIIAQYGEDIDNNTLRDVRRILDTEIKKSKGFVLPPSEGSLIDAKKLASDKIRGILAEADPNLDKLNKEYTFWSNIDKVIGDTNLRTQGQSGFGKDLMTMAGAATGNGTLDVIMKALTFRWIGSVVKSTGWRMASARIKNTIADAIATGDFATANKSLLKISPASAEAKEFKSLQTPNFLQTTQTAIPKNNANIISKTVPQKTPFVNPLLGATKKSPKALAPESKGAKILLNKAKGTENSLMNEAKKYKSAEEFVKANTVYHQSQSKQPFTEFIQKGEKGYKKASYSQANEGIYFSPNKELVQEKYGKTGGQLIETVVYPKKKLDLGEFDAMYFDGRKVSYSDIVTQNFKREMQGLKPLPEPDIILTGISKKAKEWLQKEGYDVVEGMKGEMFSAPELVVLDKSAIKTKSQLEQIWKEANKKK